MGIDEDKRNGVEYALSVWEEEEDPETEPDDMCWSLEKGPRSWAFLFLPALALSKRAEESIK